MAVDIKNIPVLKGQDAKRFIEAANNSSANRNTVDFSKEIRLTEAILEKANLK